MKKIEADWDGVWAEDDDDFREVKSLKTKAHERTEIAKHITSSPYSYGSTWVARVVCEIHLPAAINALGNGRVI